MMNTNDLRNLRDRDRDTFVTLAFFAKEANQKLARSKWSERMAGFSDGFATSYRMLRHMKVAVYGLYSIGHLEKHRLDYWKDQRKVSHMMWGVKRNRAEKKLAKLARKK